jgi:hypothetical protein
MRKVTEYRPYSMYCKDIEYDLQKKVVKGYDECDRETGNYHVKYIPNQWIIISKINSNFELETLATIKGTFQLITFNE